MKNAYEIRGDETAIFLKSRKYGRMETLISTSKLKRAEEFPGSWYPNYSDKTKTFYAKGNMPKVNGKHSGSARLHRWVTEDVEGFDVDHFDHDTLNNVDSNLRKANKSENNQNRKSAQANNKSGIRGVCWHKQSGKWQAKITINKKHMTIGRFNTIEEARIAVEHARKDLMPFSQEAV